MADTRFSWGRVDKLTGAIELQKRGRTLPGCKRKLTKDSLHPCWSPDCRRKPRAGDWVYYPAAGLPDTNKVIGHVDCIDKMVSESRRAAYAQTIGTELERLPEIPEAPRVKQPKAVAATRELAVSGAFAELSQLEQLAKIRREIYEEGFRAGVAAALEKLKALGHDGLGKS